MKKIFTLVVLSVLFFAQQAYAVTISEKILSTPEFTYAKPKFHFSITKKVIPARDVMNPQYYAENMAIDYEGFPWVKSKTLAHYKKLFSRYTKKDKAVVYTFRYLDKSQKNSIDHFRFTVVPNKIFITQKDFTAFPEGDFQLTQTEPNPFKASKKYLLFDGICGSGYSDGSSLPIGCDAIRDSIKSTLKLK